MSYVLDTSAILAGVELENAYTTTEIAREIKEEGFKLRLKIALDEGRMALQEPSARAVKDVEEAAEMTGDIAKLSRADRGILALALDMGATLVTDDYAIQNLARVLGVKYRGVKERGIREVFHWKKVCRGCRREYPLDYSQSCEVCGSRVAVRRSK